MIAALRSELKKVLTVRSTYVIILLCVVLEGIASGYGGGFKASAQQLSDPNHFSSEIGSIVGVLSVFVALIGLLLVTHEYRYNTITYTLTSARNRTTVLVAKIIVISLVALLASALFAVLSPLFVTIGTAIKGHHLVHQNMPSADLIFRALFTGWAYSMIGLIISFIARIQVAAVVTFFIFPSTVEPLLGLLLKTKQDYLPYVSVDGVLNHHSISHHKSMLVAFVWVVVGFVVSWILFKKRDAN